MIEIIPAILAESKAEFEAKVAKVGTLAKTIQIDVIDGKFVPERTWADPAAIGKMKLPYLLDVHLMVANPEAAVGAWIKAGARRVIVHAEAAGWQEAVKSVRASGAEAGVALNPETPLEVIQDHVADLDVVLVMGVDPGASGQPFQPVAIQRVAAVRLRYPEVRIEIDGGVSVKNAGELAAAGADGLVAGSVLFGSRSLEEAYEALREAALLE